jgi:hypothetical protein
MLPEVPRRKTYDDVDPDSLAYALFLNPGLMPDPVDVDADDSLLNESMVQSNQQEQTSQAMPRPRKKQP